ncbi:MAG: glycosyltransferase family 2 protein [Syntrophobacteraceae bacterium]|jgi:glycosyltransferase involved in cell wall biosynthesis
MSTPTVSVIIPTFNREHCVTEAIESVLAQSYQDFELIVVDDGSTDGTYEVLRAYGDRLKAIWQTNCGVSVARNSGIKAARGGWIAFLDSDDTWEVDKLKTQVQDLEAHPGAVAHMVDATICDGGEERLSLFELRAMCAEFGRHPFRKRPLLDVLTTQFFTSCWLVNRKTVEAAGCFDASLRIFEDIDLLTRVALEGPFVVNGYSGVKVRRRHGGSGTLSELYQKARLESLRNLVHTYCRLKVDSRLTASEYRLVRRFLSGTRSELAVQYKLGRQWGDAINAFYLSVVDDPGPRSLVRALLAGAGAIGLLKRLLLRGKRASFRRSETGSGERDFK